MTERASGHYWVRVGSLPAEVAEWDAPGACWWLTGTVFSEPPGDVAVLSGPLVPPDAPEALPVPRVAVTWATPPGADDVGEMHVGGA